MKIYYQGEPGSYSHLASVEIQKLLSCDIDVIIGCIDFDTVWEKISLWDIGILPIENSYAGSIHANVYHFLSHEHCIIGEYDFEVRHCLLSLETDISQVKEAYSHHQALSQTHLYLRSKNIKPKAFWDTAGAAKMIGESKMYGVWAIASELEGELYGLNVLERDIQDQTGNTTKFLVVVQKENRSVSFSRRAEKITLLFKTDHSPGSLCNCLEILAKKSLNLTKIESIPLGVGHFSYAFWVTFEWKKDDTCVQEALKELAQEVDFLKILWTY